MKYILNYVFFNESLLPSQFRKYVKEFNKEIYEDKFQKFKEKYDGDKNAYRLYLPYDSEIDKSETEKEIEELFQEYDYEIIDYISGTAKFKEAKNSSKIGKVLNLLLNKVEDKSKVKSLLKKFIEDPIRKSGKEEMLICISRHPYDIAGADTDREWTNCMTIGIDDSKKIRDLENKINKESDPFKIGEIKNKITNIKNSGANVKYLLDDVKEGSLIAYLIKSSDKNINNPIANLNIKPYINTNDKSDIILLSDNKMYGRGNSKFKKIVDDFLNEFNGKKSGFFSLNRNLYYDNNNFDNPIIGNFEELISKKEFQNIIGIKSYSINDDGSLDIKGDIKFNDLKGDKSKLYISSKINKITGNFSIYDYSLITIDGDDKEKVNIPILRRGLLFPREVGGSVFIQNLALNSLKGSPSIIGGDFNCTNNKLTNFKEGPKVINGDLVCEQNLLISLEGMPQVKGNIELLCPYPWSNPIKYVTNPYSYKYGKYSEESKLDWIKSKNKNELIRKFNEMGIIKGKKLFTNKLMEFYKEIKLEIEVDLDEIKKNYDKTCEYFKYLD